MAKRILIPASPADGITPGMIAVVQTFGDDLSWHPHVHALVSRGGWDRAGTWGPVPFVDGEAAALVFRHKVFSFLRAEGLLSEERMRLLLSWRHGGFSVHNTVTVPSDDRDGLERLSFDPASDRVVYARRPGRGHHHEAAAAERLTDPKELLARVLLHIPEPRRHVIRYYGAYSSVVRARCVRQTIVVRPSRLAIRACDSPCSTQVTAYATTCARTPAEHRQPCALPAAAFRSRSRSS